MRLGGVARADKRIEVATELAQPLVMAAHRARDVARHARGRAVGSVAGATMGAACPAADATPARLARELVEDAARRDAARRRRKNVDRRREHVARRCTSGLARMFFRLRVTRLWLIEVAIEFERRGVCIGRVGSGVRIVVHVVELGGYARALAGAAALRVGLVVRGLAPHAFVSIRPDALEDEARFAVVLLDDGIDSWRRRNARRLGWSKSRAAGRRACHNARGLGRLLR